VNLVRIRYVIRRIARDTGNLCSRAVNALLLNGSTAQTVSARAHIDSITDPVWERRRQRINRLFFWEDDHCRQSWEAEVERARYVLSRLERG
jgi:hypothetical protein